jgi:NAD(P)-dependent dehydrogenase (short-subunit alcohol dehydrogenase family)
MLERTWLITGINRGLGRDLAEALLERGDRVAGTARKPTELDDLKAKYGERLWTAALDLTDAGAIQSVVDRAFTELGRIDVVVNNAGSSLVGAVEECSEEMIRHLLDTNLLGSILMVKVILPHLRAQGGGRILQVSSALGQLAIPGLSLYVASKSGIEGFIESTALEVAPFGIEVTIFEPGSIRTDFSAKASLSPAIAAYDGTPARGIRSRVESVRDAGEKSSTSPGDPAKMAKVIIDSVDQSPAPKRVVMGSDAYNGLTAAYRERAASLETQKALALSTDF